METLLDLRKKAQKLGIEDYAQYSKNDLRKKIEEIENGNNPSTVVETETDPNEEKEVQEKIDKGEVQEISSEEAEGLKADQKLKKKRAPKKEVKEEVEEEQKEETAEETKEEKPVEEKPSKAEKAAMKAAEKRKKAAEKEAKKKTKRSSFVYKYIPRGKKPKDLGPTSSKVYDELIQSNESVYKIAKRMGTYFSIVDRIVSKFFDVQKEECAPKEK